MALTMEQQAAAYRAKSAEEKAALQARKELTQRVIAAGGVPTQARLDAITTKTAATRAASAAAPTKQAAPDKMVRDTSPVDPSRSTGGSAVAAAPPDYYADSTPAYIGGIPAEGTAAAVPVTTSSYRARNLPPGVGELDANGKPIPRSTRPFRRGGTRSNRRRGRKMPLPTRGTQAQSTS